ncbi:cupin domain-containing protein [Pseudomonas chlororaphis]|uniref:AraC family transcriptional regulator n=1 Tax=Pseudomonas chlororaphis TaxID=587753 RepID=A0AAX3FTS3_9PSED|nr:AraC family transcriptional regulator [Pseudomonas chlororaphis]AZC39434.1 Transcriptional regulator, AraC family [Pseudomonas chlororaphis subsp. piscium]AZC45986.1 Transcriptional regulator, AraC family [Pseudomonas chlororaphis subsp. piscium]QHC91356.1 AraC family transcriptional regulator [Pseudomonas chlororaphis]WDG71519.1 AraC family transcriptional regulator [Pseudomonas chlororaphis]WDH30697.1 AraC family transcriptional regulator [Pseudomonas chlororaphis]
MDALSQLLSLARMRVALDVRCLFGGKFEIRHDPLPAGEAIFHLLLSGRCWIRLDNERELVLKGGDFVLLPRGDVHTIVHDNSAEGAAQPVRTLEGGVLPLKCNDAGREEGAVDLLCGRYSYASGAGSLLTEWLPDVLHVCLLDTAGGSTLDALIKLLRAEVAGEPQPGAGAVINGLGQALLGFALRVHAQNENAAAGLLRLMVDSRLGPSVRAVLAAPGHPWTIASLGETVAMSRATYARHFQARAGFGVGEFLMRVRMTHACVLLEQGRRSIAEVAEAVGYSSEVAFGKAFRNAIGETPGRWRRSLRG